MTNLRHGVRGLVHACGVKFWIGIGMMPRRKLEAVATKHIRNEINMVLPKVYQQLLEALEHGEA